MPQTGPRRQNVAVRLLDEELALLRAVSRTTDRSISDLLRDLMELPPGDRVLARRSTSELRLDLAEHADAHPVVRALWATAVHRALEQRFPATVEEFLDLYAARVAAHPAWAPDRSSRTVVVDDDLEIVVGFGGPDAGLRLAPRVPSRDRTLPTALLRGPALPSVAEMRELLADTGRRARRVAADG
jgi:hypothetical protein